VDAAEKIAFYLLKKVNPAVRDHQLIEDGTVERDCPQAKVNLSRAVRDYERRCSV